MPAPKGHAPYAGSETGGRPQKYTKEYLDKLADEFLEWLKVPDNYWFKSFAVERDLIFSELVENMDRSEKFSEAYRIAKQTQEERIVKGGIKGSFNTQISKFALANCHKWSERSETTISGSAENPLHFLLSGVEGASKDLVREEELD